ncbi:MAG: hypothetical protein IJU31_01530 [Synergistaceae bacterium]|nr:hypothetical protein [Synergistaceae bacterium]
MTYLKKRRRNNNIYLYEIQGYRDKDGKVKHKERCVGKIDDDGVLITAKRKIPVKITRVRRITTKLIFREEPELDEPKGNEGSEDPPLSKDDINFV